MYAKYHDTRSSGSPDILFTRLLYYTQKRGIIQSNIYRILPNFNQVINTLHTNCMPNIMILAQIVFQIFCSQCPLWQKCLRLRRGIIQSNFDIILQKLYHVIYIMYTNSKPDIKILAQAVLQIFYSHGSIGLQCKS